VKLPRIGLVRTHESTRKLARHVERGTARIRSATVSHQGGRWFCSFSVEIERHDPAPARPDSVVGVDLGIKSLAVLSTGEVIANPRHLEIAQRELRRLQRQAARRTGPDRRTRQQSSQRWRKTQARIAELHTAVANARRDGLHQLTTRLVRKHAAIVIENLNVAGMCVRIPLSPSSTSRMLSLRGFRIIGRMTWFGRGWCVTRLRACPPVSMSHPCGSAIPPSGRVSVSYAMSSPGLSVSHRNTSLASPGCGLSSPVLVAGLGRNWLETPGFTTSRTWPRNSAQSCA
jgi:hypothetical protein